MKRIVFTTFGSLGDLHPFIAIALELKRRGRQVLIVTSTNYRDKLAALGLPFAPLRPSPPDLVADPRALERYMDLRFGTMRVLHEIVLPALRQSFDDVMAATRTGDVLVSHPLTLATVAAAEKRKVPWASATLTPLGFFSAHDPPVISAAPFLARLRALGPAATGAVHGMLKASARRWMRPIDDLRASEGLPARPNPLFEGQHSASLVLALFSRVFAAPQPDWPKSTVVTGFPEFDDDGAASAQGLSPEMERFLADGPAPLVFTLGSSAVHDARDFYVKSLAAAQLLQMRAVFLIGRGDRNALGELPKSAIAAPYAPFSKLFPRAAAVIHQGGIGTTAQAMRAGRPMLVVPYAHDQPDNAARVQRLGIARVLTRRGYGPRNAAAALSRLVQDGAVSANVARIGEVVRAENGARTAADALESRFASL